MAQLTDDCFAHGGPLMRVDEARKPLAEIITPVTSNEPVALHQALGRILAEDIVSPEDVPPDPNSAVAGYAVLQPHVDPADETRLPVIRRHHPPPPPPPVAEHGGPHRPLTRRQHT